MHYGLLHPGLMFNRFESGASPDISDRVYYGIRTACKSLCRRLAGGPLILTFVTALILQAAEFSLFRSER
jgi:hypothetical protein